MFRIWRAAIGLFIFAMALLAVSASASAPQPTPLKIGMVSSIFRDLPDSKIQTLLPELQILLRDHSGLHGEFIIAGDAFEVGSKLNDKSIQFGVFHGFEFAWARQQYPDLKPLLIAINRHNTLKAFVAVNNESKVLGLADLKGKIISFPRRMPAHCRLFLERELAAMGSKPEDFFAKIVQHDSVEDALDDILRNKVQATLVDGESLENYSQVNPGRFARLKMLLQADNFPPGLVAYRQGGVDEAVLTKFKQGMLKANSTTTGKEQMALWKMSAFENIPADYELKLGEILKRFPPAKSKEGK